MSRNYTVAGNFYAPRFDYIELKLYRCNPSKSSVTCSPNLVDVMKQSKLEMVVSNTYVDFDNYQQPVQSFLDDKFFWDLMPGFRKKTDIYFRKNEAQLVDDLVQLGQSTRLSFYQVKTFREQTELEGTDLQFASIYFRFDAYYDVYQRRVYSLGDLFGQIGGLYSSVFVVGAVFVAVFSERLFVSSILRKIYQIDQLRENEIKACVSKNNGSVTQQPNELTYGNQILFHFVILANIATILI